jgi:hypothetical protein
MHLYINGIYWGLYNPVERPNASFSATYYGGEKEEWDALNTSAVVDGSDDAWKELTRVAALVNTPDLTASNVAYQRLSGNRPDGTSDPAIEPLLDVDNLIDYMILNLYAGNTDWPSRNWYAGRQRGVESTGYKFYSWDSEWIFDLKSSLTTDRTEVDTGVAVVYGQLRNHPEFRLRFADRVNRAFSPVGPLFVDRSQPDWDPSRPDLNMPAARYAKLADQVELALIAESARWGDQHFQPSYTVADWRAERDSLLSDYFPRRSAIVLEQFRRAGLYPRIDAPQFSLPAGSVTPGSDLAMTGSGTIYYTLDGTDPRRGVVPGNGSPDDAAGTASRFDRPIELRGTVVVKARSLVDGRWSALHEATYFAGPPSLRVTEIMYHPADASAAEKAAGFFADDDFEYIKVTNVSADRTASLSGVRFTAGIQFDFSKSPIKALKPGESVIVAQNTRALQTRYGGNLPLAGQYGDARADNRLSNSGELVQLVDGTGALIQEFVYSADWHPSTDGTGYSLEIIDASQPDLNRWNLPGSWRASQRLGGSLRGDVVGDFNSDGQTDGADLALLCAAIQVHASGFDLTNDMATDLMDLTIFVTSVLHTNFGDANLDGVFDSSDLVLVFQGGEYEDVGEHNSTWSDGDWNCDGEFGTADLVLAFQSGAYESTARTK